MGWGCCSRGWVWGAPRLCCNWALVAGTEGGETRTWGLRRRTRTLLGRLGELRRRGCREAIRTMPRWGRSCTLGLSQRGRRSTSVCYGAIRRGRLACCFAMPGGPVRTGLVAVPAAAGRFHIPGLRSSAVECVNCRRSNRPCLLPGGGRYRAAPPHHLFHFADL